MILSDEFFESLRRHALPLIRALQRNARGLDIYTWMAHRLPRVRGQKGDFVSWKALQGQFGADMKRVRDFKRRFLKLAHRTLLCRCLVFVHPE